MGGFEASLDHLKNHIEYPADAEVIVQACSNMSEVAADDREWFVSNLPARTYQGPDEVLSAVMEKL